MWGVRTFRDVNELVRIKSNRERWLRQTSLKVINTIIMLMVLKIYNFYFFTFILFYYFFNSVKIKYYIVLTPTCSSCVSSFFWKIKFFIIFWYFTVVILIGEMILYNSLINLLCCSSFNTCVRFPGKWHSSDK